MWEMTVSISLIQQIRRTKKLREWQKSFQVNLIRANKYEDECTKMANAIKNFRIEVFYI